MARGRKQKLKLFYLYKFFRENSDKTHPLTMPQIVELLEAYGVDANRKALYDDIEALRLFGIDIEKKKEGLYTYYYATNRPFELAEMKILIDAVQASKFISEKETKVLIQKLLFLVGESDARLLERDVHVPGRIKNMDESVYQAVDVIFHAQELDHQLRFHYFCWDLQGKKELRRNGDYYNVSPWNLIYDDEKYYLVGYDHLHKEIRHFRVDKMLDVEVVDLKRKGVTKFRQINKAKYTQQHFRMYGGELQTVTLLCENEMSNVIIDQFGRNTVMRPVDEEHFEVRVDVAVSD
ncbi:MAG: WYL domain-containing protein, partial [Eubacterium sp.]|nr:WYL domain-containing protein [Eubacterium sp.]